MSLLGATILTAVATLLLAVFALATAVLAFMAWRKQSREVSDQAKMLKLQTKELRQLSAVRKREVQERRRAQAVQVYAWWTMGVDSSADGVQVIAYVRNTSQQPVYGVSLNVPPGGAKMRLEALLPGQEHSAPFTYDPTPRASLKSVADFVDRSGVRWRTWSDGRLEEVPRHAEPKGTNIPGSGASVKGKDPDVGELWEQIPLTRAGRRPSVITPRRYLSRPGRPFPSRRSRPAARLRRQHTATFATSVATMPTLSSHCASAGTPSPPPGRIHHYHRTRVDETVHPQGDEAPGRPYQSARVLVRHDRGDTRPQPVPLTT